MTSTASPCTPPCEYRSAGDCPNDESLAKRLYLALRRFEEGEEPCSLELETGPRTASCLPSSLCRTAERPAPPYVTARAAPTEQLPRMQAALHAAVEDPEASDALSVLMLDCFVELELESCDAIVDLQACAEVQGYFELNPCIG